MLQKNDIEPKAALVLSDKESQHSFLELVEHLKTQVIDTILTIPTDRNGEWVKWSSEVFVPSVNVVSGNVAGREDAQRKVISILSYILERMTLVVNQQTANIQPISHGRLRLSLVTGNTPPWGF